MHGPAHADVASAIVALAHVHGQVDSWAEAHALLAQGLAVLQPYVAGLPPPGSYQEGLNPQPTTLPGCYSLAGRHAGEGPHEVGGSGSQPCVPHTRTEAGSAAAEEARAASAEESVASPAEEAEAACTEQTTAAEEAVAAPAEDTVAAPELEAVAAPALEAVAASALEAVAAPVLEAVAAPALEAVAAPALEAVAAPALEAVAAPALEAVAAPALEAAAAPAGEAAAAPAEEAAAGGCALQADVAQGPEPSVATALVHDGEGEAPQHAGTEEVLMTPLLAACAEELPTRLQPQASATARSRRGSSTAAEPQASATARSRRGSSTAVDPQAPAAARSRRGSSTTGRQPHHPPIPSSVPDWRRYAPGVDPLMAAAYAGTLRAQAGLLHSSGQHSRALALLMDLELLYRR